MAEDLRFELAILATVQGFYQKLMVEPLGGEVPVPSGLDEDALRHSERELPNTLTRMYRWLHLLDMAITPAMLRQALTPDTDSEGSRPGKSRPVARRPLARGKSRSGLRQQNGSFLDSAPGLSRSTRSSCTFVPHTHQISNPVVTCTESNLSSLLEH